MNEKYPFVNETTTKEHNTTMEGNTPKVDTTAKNTERSTTTHSINKTRAAAVITLLMALGLTSCGDKISDTRDKIVYRNDPIGLQMKQQERIEKGEEELERLKHEMEVKIGQYKPLTKKYKSQKEKLDKDPNNKVVRKRVWQLKLEIDSRVNEIISLSEKAKKLEVELDDKRSKINMWAPSGNRYTNENFFDYLEDYFGLNPTTTAYFPDYVNTNPTEYVEDEHLDIDYVEDDF